MRHSSAWIFPENELLKEKEVIIDEINSYLDNPSEQIFDDFEEQLFQSQSIGRNILGTSESLKKIHRKDISDFTENNDSQFCTLVGIILYSV